MSAHVRSYLMPPEFFGPLITGNPPLPCQFCTHQPQTQVVAKIKGVCYVTTALQFLARVFSASHSSAMSVMASISTVSLGYSFTPFVRLFSFHCFCSLCYSDSGS